MCPEPWFTVETCRSEEFSDSKPHVDRPCCQSCIKSPPVSMLTVLAVFSSKLRPLHKKYPSANAATWRRPTANARSSPFALHRCLSISRLLGWSNFMQISTRCVSIFKFFQSSCSDNELGCQFQARVSPLQVSPLQWKSDYRRQYPFVIYKVNLMFWWCLYLDVNLQLML